MCQIHRRSFLGASAAIIGNCMTRAEENHLHNHVLQQVAGSGAALRHQVSVISLMTESANRFLAALEPEQRAKAVLPFEDEQRFDWHFIPKERKGLALREMNPFQKQLASALLASGLSQAGFIKAVTIMSLDEILKIMERDSGERRNPEKYHFTIFGTPSGSGTWGWRVEGHHLSQNYTVSKGEVVDAPSFFGANPAEVPQGPRKGLRVLSAEDDMGFELLRMLDETSLKTAIVDAKAYGDILTAANRKAALSGRPSGLAAAGMKAGPFDALRALAELYANNLPDELAKRRLKQIDQAGRNVYFAWAGGSHPGDPHYYRIQTSSFLIEFDDTQDKANHIHSVWRDLQGDFGGDLLAAHYRSGHPVKEG
jgi:hypothetical protein